MLIQLCYERPIVTTTDLVEWLPSKWVRISKTRCLFLYIEEIDFRFFCVCVFCVLCVCVCVCFFFFHESFMYMTHVNASNYFIQHHCQAACFKNTTVYVLHRPTSLFPPYSLDRPRITYIKTNFRSLGLGFESCCRRDSFRT